MTRILTIDGNWLARRVFEGTADCAGTFRKAVLNAVEKFSPETVAIAWDSPPNTYIGRRRLIPNYKANRGPSPEGYSAALRQVKKMAKGEGWYQFSGPGEGDDVIATIVETMPGPHTIYSVDKDLFQLVRAGVSFYRALGTGTLYTDENLEAETGLTADGWVSYLSIVGDAADNLPGVRGVGDVGARLLLGAFPGIVSQIICEDTRDAAVETAKAFDPPVGRVATRCAEQHYQLTQTWLAVTLRTIKLKVEMPNG
jgi:5'-3' exonuclease